jgi:hypothetical protein
VSTDVATPISPKPAALASDAISKKGTPVVMTLESSFGIITVWEKRVLQYKNATARTVGILNAIIIFLGSSFFNLNQTNICFY